jgi:predicted Zn-dependent protease
MKKTLLAASLALALAAPTPFAAADLPDLGDPSSASMSGADEVRIGKGVVASMRADHEISDDAEIGAYLNALGSRISAYADAPDLHFEYFLVPDPTINAFALPGGFVGVNSGLILATQSEAELASVLGHESAHVAQHHMARMQASNGANQLVVLAAILAGALAAYKGNGQAGFGAINAGIGLSIQNQLSYSRDYEREADRFGQQYMSAAGFDARAMPAFFQRLQQASRYSDNNALAFLRTHPVTVERISESENRALNMPVHMRADSTDYVLVREKVRVQTQGADEALRFYQGALSRRQFLSEGAIWYGMARCRLVKHDTAGARAALAEARRLLPSNPMLFMLDAEIASAAGDANGARSAFTAGLTMFPSNRALLLSELDFLLERGEQATVRQRLHELIGEHPGDPALYRLQARLFADRDALRYHAALGNAMYYEANYGAAMEQFQLASKAPGEDFYLRSSIEARIRELDKLLKEEAKNKGKPGSSFMTMR